VSRKEIKKAAAEKPVVFPGGGFSLVDVLRVRLTSLVNGDLRRFEVPDDDLPGVVAGAVGALDGGRDGPAERSPGFHRDRLLGTEVSHRDDGRGAPGLNRVPRSLDHEVVHLELEPLHPTAGLPDLPLAHVGSAGRVQYFDIQQHGFSSFVAALGCSSANENSLVLPLS